MSEPSDLSEVGATSTNEVAASAPADLPAGWGMPQCSRKAHYFRAGDTMSLCNGVGFYRGPRDDTQHDSPDNCAQCRKRRARMVSPLKINRVRCGKREQPTG